MSAVSVEIRAPAVSVEIRAPEVKAKIGVPVAREYVEAPAYPGPYTVTPTTSTQTLYVNGQRMTQNVVVNPIPSNYGLITWDGSVLTVS